MTTDLGVSSLYSFTQGSTTTMDFDDWSRWSFFCLPFSTLKRMGGVVIVCVCMTKPGFLLRCGPYLNEARPHSQAMPLVIQCVHRLGNASRDGILTTSVSREGLINSRFQQTSAESTGNLTDCRLKLRINQTFPSRHRTCCTKNMRAPCSEQQDLWPAPHACLNLRSRTSGLGIYRPCHGSNG